MSLTLNPFMNFRFTLLLWLTVIHLFASCGDAPKDPSSSGEAGTLSLYGLDLGLHSASLVQRNDVNNIRPKAVEYTHTYIDDQGVEKNVIVKGISVGDHKQSSSYYTLAFYESSIDFSEVRQAYVGKGAAVNFHLFFETRRPTLPGTLCPR